MIDDETEKPPSIIRLVQPPPPNPIKERGVRATDPPAAEQASGPTMPQRPPPRPSSFDIVTIDVASGPDARCRLCDKPVEPGAVQLNYPYSPLIHIKVSFCSDCAAATLLGAMERRFKPMRDAEAAADYAEGRQHGFTRAEMAALALQGFGGLPLKSRKMSGEFIAAAISLAGKLRNDWYRGHASSLSNDTLIALQELLQSLGEELDGSRRVR